MKNMKAQAIPIANLFEFIFKISSFPEIYAPFHHFPPHVYIGIDSTKQSAHMCDKKKKKE